MPKPLVTVAITCYNQANHIEAALLSVLRQSYSPIEIILTDDASTDESAQVIKLLAQTHKLERVLLHQENKGLCQRFNEALALAKGKYIIDLSADDELLQERVAEGVRLMEKYPQAGLHFCQVEEETLTEKMVKPKADAFTELSERMFPEVLGYSRISTPSFFFRVEFLRKLGGYDESLSYEDFDILLRIARNYQFSFSPKMLVKKRRLEKSMGSESGKRKHQHRKSTLKICAKAYPMCLTKDEFSAFLHRCAYEGWDALRNGEVLLAIRFFWWLLPGAWQWLRH